MAADIVKQLRKAWPNDGPTYRSLIAEAAEEIERLREALQEIARPIIHYEQLDVLDENYRQRRAQQALNESEAEDVALP